MSEGPLTLSRMPRAPSMLASSSGLEIAARRGGNGAAVARRVPDAHQRGTRVREDHLHVGEVGVDEAGRGDQIGDPLHALQQHFVGHLERVQHRRALVAHLEQALVRDDDDRVDLLLQLRDPRLGLHRATTTFETERPGDDTDGQRADLLGDLRDDGRATGTGAAAFARGDEDHVGAFQHLFDLLTVLFGRLLTDLGIGAGAEAAGERATDVELHVGVGQQQRLRVGVDGDELHTLQAGVDHPVDCVAATATDTDDLDHREIVLRSTEHGS